MKDENDKQTQDLLDAQDRRVRWRNRQREAGLRSRSVWATDEEIVLVRKYLEELRNGRKS